MPIAVSLDDEVTTYDNANQMEVDTHNNLIVQKKDDTGVVSVLGIHSSGAWDSAKKNKKEDVQLKLEEALDLLEQVDDGKFSNQGDDWRERVQELLND